MKKNDNFIRHSWQVLILILYDTGIYFTFLTLFSFSDFDRFCDYSDGLNEVYRIDKTEKKEHKNSGQYNLEKGKQNITVIKKTKDTK